MIFTIDSALGSNAAVSSNVLPATIEKFELLNAADQLALIWFAYHEIGKSVAIASPVPANLLLAQPLLQQIQQLSEPEQLQVLCDLADRNDTAIGRTYAALAPNIKLSFWFQLGQWMDVGAVASIPRNYRLSQGAIAVLILIESLDAGQQIAVLRHMVIGMGYNDGGVNNTAPSSQSLPEPMAASHQSPAAIEGVVNDTVLHYVDRLNCGDFAAVANLFARDGALQPPFQKPIVGQAQILQYLQAECQNFQLFPRRGFVSYQDDRLTKLRVTGQVQTSWFGKDIDLNIALRFLLDADNKIFLVAVDLLAAPAELLALLQ